MKCLKVAIMIFTLTLGLGKLAVAHVALDYPTGEETFTQGDSIDIQWHILIPHDLQNWDLYFSDNGGTTWQTIALDLPPAQLDYTWEVPSPTTGQGRIRIYMDNSGTDYEDQSGDFTILALVVPTLSEWGLVILGLLIIAAGTIAIIRRFEIPAKIVQR